MYKKINIRFESIVLVEENIRYQNTLEEVRTVLGNTSVFVKLIFKDEKLFGLELKFYLLT